MVVFFFIFIYLFLYFFSTNKHREVDIETGNLKVETANKFLPGAVYQGGNLKQFESFMGCRGPQVCLFMFVFFVHSCLFLLFLIHLFLSFLRFFMLEITFMLMVKINK